MWRRARAVDLSVVGILVWGQTMALNQRSKVGDVQNEEDWPEHWALWNATNQGNGRWPCASATDELPSTGQIRTKPVPCDIGDPKARFETLKEDVVVYRVECRWQVQKDQGGKIATVNSEEDVRQDAQDGGLGGVTWPEERGYEIACRLSVCLSITFRQFLANKSP